MVCRASPVSPECLQHAGLVRLEVGSQQENSWRRKHGRRLGLQQEEGPHLDENIANSKPQTGGGCIFENPILHSMPSTSPTPCNLKM